MNDIKIGLRLAASGLCKYEVKWSSVILLNTIYSSLASRWAVSTTSERRSSMESMNIKACANANLRCNIMELGCEGSHEA